MQQPTELRFEREVVLADTLRRRIVGLVVPFGETGVIGGREYRFRPGSVRVGRRVPMLVDHDRGHPIGVLDELLEHASGISASFAIDETPAGDEALKQAASGSRGALSIGADLVDATMGRDGVVDVADSIVREVSLLALGAFDSAEVLHVAAELDEPPPADEPDDDEEPPADPPPVGDDQEELELDPVDPDDPDAGAAGDDPEEEETETMTTEAEAAPSMILATRDRAQRELGPGELCAYIVAARHGDKEAGRFIEAALLETNIADVGGLLPPTWETTILGGKPTPRPLYQAFQSKPLPGVGLMVNKPVWVTPPDGAWAADLEADATSTKVVVGSQAATVQRWDWAGAIPYVVVMRSDPSIVDTIYAAAIQDWYYDVEAKIAGEVLAAPPGVATTLGAGIAEFWEACNRAPETIVVSPDVWGELADQNELNHPLAGGDVSSGDSTLRSTFAGIPIVASGALAPGDAILATRRAVDARVTDPVRLTANAIGALNLELAVVGEGLFDTDYPSELLKLALAPPAGRSSTSSSSKAKD